MEELHKVARAYYDNGSQEVRFLTQKFFEAMDTDRNGSIQMTEFMDFLNRDGYINQYMNCYLFAELDRDRNGVLDFNEFLTLYYVIKTKNGFCWQCWRCLKGLYFTCVACFDCPPARTFDLCPDCYNVSNRRVYHPHTNFADSALLLRARRNNFMVCDPSPSSSQAVEEGIKRMMHVLEVALAAGAVGVSAFCSIM